MRVSSASQDYFDWLCEKVSASDADGDSWYLLLCDLFRTDFIAVIPRDENRALDGIQLREEYISENPDWNDIDVNEPCSMLEMLIALANRMEFQADGTHNSRGASSGYFWELIDNLGLSACSDSKYALNLNETKSSRILTALNRLNHRTYRQNGHGGLFPLTHPSSDQRKKEIFLQMQEYLSENYPVM